MGEWLLVEVYRENGGEHRFVVEAGLSEEEARAIAAESREDLGFMGITGHWVEAVPDPAGAS